MSLDLAVKGLAVLTAIPVTMLALWADQKERSLPPKGVPEGSRAQELLQVRGAAAIAVIAQLLTFLASGDVREHSPFASYGLFLGAILLQRRFTRKLEHRIEPPAAGSARAAPRSWEATRAFAWAAFGGALYLVGFGAPVVAASVLARWLHASPAVSAASMLLSAVLGMATGLGVNFALAPHFVRNALPVRAPEDQLKARLSACFEEAGLPAPAIWLVEGDAAHEGAVMMTGFPSGRGWFRPALFVSSGVVAKLTDEELEAVAFHEAAHLRLGHLRRRLAYTSCSLVGATLSALALVFAAGALFPGRGLAMPLGYAVAAAAFVATFRLLSKQSREHELEADRHAVESFLASAEALASALRKLDPSDGRGAATPWSLIAGRTHPSTELRIERLMQAARPGESDGREAA